MFERFTTRSKDTIAQAQEAARSLGHNYIGTEHLLLGLLHDPDSMAGKYLTDCGVTFESVRIRVVELVGPVALSDQDAEALSAIGIDLDAVRAAVEATFGPGALDAPETPPQRVTTVGWFLSPEPGKPGRETTRSTHSWAGANVSE